MPVRQDDNRPHYLIVGAGIAGLSLAYELSKFPVNVTVLEAGQLGQQGASSVPIALLNPYRGRTARASQLDLNGLSAMHDLNKDLKDRGLDAGIHVNGVLRIASSAKQARQWSRLDVPWLEPADIPQAYHAPFGAMLIGEGGWVEPRKLLHVLQQEALRQGAHFVERCRFDACEQLGSKLLARHAFGETVVDGIVLCTGANLLADVSLPLLERLAGDVIALDTELTLEYPIAGAIYGVKKEAQVFIGGNHRPSDQKDDQAASKLQASASWFIKSLKEAELHSTWTGIRAKQKNNRPLIVGLRPKLWFYGALAGRGFLCAAHVSRQFAQDLYQVRST